MEITGDLKVTIEEETLLDMHSVLNVLNVINYEVMNLAELLGDSPAMESLYDKVSRAAALLRDRQQAHRQIENVRSFIDMFTETLETEISRAGMEKNPEIGASVANLKSIFSILQIRAREIVARHANPDAWVDHDIPSLKDNFLNVLQAIERNSKGGYRIVYNLAEHEDGNYLVNFDISSANGKTVTMPAVFQDVMRDLLANARKYTPPGGTINAGLYDSGTELRYVVWDTGVGIPENELDSVVAFGGRGSNTEDRPTRGGGFGLTKAYYITRKFNGRMWIDSPANARQGTRIEIRLPRAR
jgi:signal transduction histidine kinase